VTVISEEKQLLLDQSRELEELRAQARFEEIHRRAIGDDIARDYLERGEAIPRLAQRYKLPKDTIYAWIIEYQQKRYTDARVTEMALLDVGSHISVIGQFLANAHYLSRETAFTALFARRVREEIADRIAREGLLAAVTDEPLMKAWTLSERKLVSFSNLSPKYLDSYVKLMKETLDMQKEVAFVKVLYDLVARLDPDVAQKLQQTLREDEYARAVMESLSGEELVSVFKQRGLRALVPESHIDAQSLELEHAPD
jgi:hypothetical protein